MVARKIVNDDDYGPITSWRIDAANEIKKGREEERKKKRKVKEKVFSRALWA